MKIAVCIRRGRDGEINPFDACAYEAALQIEGAEITLVSMGPESVRDFLVSLTRLGAKGAVLLSDKAFAGADTLATAYTLGRLVAKIRPDLIFCGRQTLEGDTAQTGPMLSVEAGYSLITNVMAIKEVSGGRIVCDTRGEGEQSAQMPALITVERINTLRRPRLRSKTAECEVWSAEELGADISRCGLSGSPTRVISTFENSGGRRKCRFIAPEELLPLINEALGKNRERLGGTRVSDIKLDRVFCVGGAPVSFAETVSDDITVINPDTCEAAAEIIKRERPNAVLWGSDTRSKRMAAQTAALLRVGLCADCTSLETDGQELFMIRPALSGSVIAKIKSTVRPAMATVRTVESELPDIMVAVGFGARDDINTVRDFAGRLGAGFAATRKLVDNGILPYEYQVGLTGKTVSPPVYIAVGVSGAVHHIVGMSRAGTVIAINPDRQAPVFDYADYGIIASADILK